MRILRPTAAMRRTVAEASHDDVGEDPTVNSLQKEKAARNYRPEAASRPARWAIKSPLNYASAAIIIEERRRISITEMGAPSAVRQGVMAIRMRQAEQNL